MLAFAHALGMVFEIPAAVYLLFNTTSLGLLLIACTLRVCSCYSNTRSPVHVICTTETYCAGALFVQLLLQQHMARLFLVSMCWVAVPGVGFCTAACRCECIMHVNVWGSVWNHP
jgi:hypothetical protein